MSYQFTAREFELFRKEFARESHRIYLTELLEAAIKAVPKKPARKVAKVTRIVIRHK